jgi:hypothetical protein
MLTSAGRSTPLPSPVASSTGCSPQYARSVIGAPAAPEAGNVTSSVYVPSRTNTVSPATAIASA